MDRHKNTHTFSIDFKSELDDRHYVGEFTAKKLAIKDLAQMGVRKAELNGGKYYDSEKPGTGIDPYTDSLNSMIAHLELALIKVPMWWDLNEISDADLLNKVYEEVLSFEYRFRRPGRRETPTDQPRESGERDGKASEAEADSSGSPREVVGGKVQSSLEP